MLLRTYAKKPDSKVVLVLYGVEGANYFKKFICNIDAQSLLVSLRRRYLLKNPYEYHKTFE